MDPDDPRLPRRPLAALILLSLPVVGVALTALAYAGMWAVGWRGRPAEGPEVALGFAGCAEAGPVIEARLRDMGLRPSLAPGSEGRGDSFVVTVKVPADPRVAALIPATLAEIGELAVTGDGVTLASGADVVEASARMDLLMIPTTKVVLTPDAVARIHTFAVNEPYGKLVYTVDGAPAGALRAEAFPMAGEIELAPDLPEGQARWDRVAAWSVTVDHRLPCPLGPR